jgi:hypothetical protein
MTASRKPRNSLPTITYTEDDLDYIDALDPAWEMRFSCNRYDVWPTDSWGYSRRPDRRVVLDDCPLLRKAHRLVTRIDQSGGRFILDPSGGRMILCRSGKRIPARKRSHRSCCRCG